DVTTRLGRRVRTTLPHPFLTIDGWKPLSDVRPGDHIAVPRCMPVFGTARLGEERVKLLGYLIGDGAISQGCPSFINNDPRLVADFQDAIARFGGVSVRERADHPSHVVRADPESAEARHTRFGALVRERLMAARTPISSLAARVGVEPSTVVNWCAGRTTPGGRHAATLCAALDIDPTEAEAPGNALKHWLKSLGVWGKGAHEKFVPDVVFKLHREEVAILLNRLFATDGWATVLTSGQAQLGYCSVSERLSRQVQHLLLRFGVIASLRRRRVRYKGGFRAALQLEITDARSITTFIDTIGIFGKEVALERVTKALAAKRYQTNRDLIPVGAWTRVNDARKGCSWRAIAGAMGLVIPGYNLHVGRRAL